MTSTPPGALSDSATRVLLAICEGNYLYSELMAVTGLTRTTLSRNLGLLRDAGLVTWDDGHQGTLRPKVGLANTHPARLR